MADDQVDEKWEWFCGENSTDLEFFVDFHWDKEQVLNNTCLVDAFLAGPQALFIVVFSAVLFVLGCCAKYRSYRSRFLIRFPGHSYKWIISMLLFLVLLASLGEGILTNDTYRANNYGTQSHFYVAPVTASLALILSLVFHQMMELWQTPYMVFVLVIYWATSVASEAAQLLNLLQLEESILTENQTLWNVMRFDLVVCRMGFYSLLFLLDLNVIRAKVFKCGRNPADEKFPQDLKHDGMLYVHDYVNKLSESSFWWLNWLLSLGYKRPLEREDLGLLPEAHEARSNHQKFWKAFLVDKVEKAKFGKPPSLWKVYFKVYGVVMSGAFFLKLASDLLNFVGPLCVGGITLYVTGIIYPSPDKKPVDPGFVSFDEYFANGFILVLTMFSAALARAFLLQMYFHWVIVESIHVRSAIQTMVYEKSLCLSTFATTGGLMTMGQITNHMSTDAMAVMYMFQTVHYLITIPIQLIITLVLLYIQMGYSALIGAAMFLVVMPIQVVVASQMSKIQKDVLKFSDERLKQSNELLNGIKLLKLYGWESLYCHGIEAIRSKELWAMFKINGCTIITIFFTMATPMMVTLVSFGIYEFLEKVALTPDVAFSSLALFNQLALPLFILPMSLAFVVNAIVSTKRLQGFLVAPQVEEKKNEEDWRQCSSDSTTDEDAMPAVTYKQPGYKRIPEVYSDDDLNASSDSRLLRSSSPNQYSYGALDGSAEDEHTFAAEELLSDIAVKIQHGSFTWDQESTTPIIDDINVEIPAGKLTIVVGQVGTGKSSLISAILGEMTTLRGTVQFNRESNVIAYASQKAWLLNASLKENILFGQTDDHRRYKKCIDACALQADLDILPGGDQTEIGEKGINLSGGQKQRVSVARTIYSGHGIVILDDPLSALDVHVGSHLFQEGIMEMLVKNKQTVILVTHQLQYLQSADLVIVMKDGKIQHQGTLDEIRDKDPEMYTTWQDAIYQASESEAALSDSGEETDTLKEERENLKRQISKQMSIDDTKKMIDAEGAKLMEKEEMERGAVSLSVYSFYLKAIGIPLVFLVSLGTIMQSSLYVGTNFWLTAWSEAGLKNDNRSTTDFVIGYAGLSFATILSQLLAVSSLIIASLIAARKLHSKMLRNMIKVPMRFFDTTPIGRVLNRFSSDTQLIDMRLAQTYNGLLGSFMQCLAALIVNTIVVPYFILVVLPLAVAYYFMQKYFITTSRELQRLDSVTKSPVFAYFSETLGGLATIRAYKVQKRFYKTIMERINTNLGAYLYLQTANRWLGVRLDMVGAIIVLLAGMSTVLGALYFGVEPSLVGLAITYALQVSGYLNWLVRNVADIEMQMNAVERVQYYSKIPTEHYEGLEPPPDWPNEGEICVENISVRYARDLDPVLKQYRCACKDHEVCWIILAAVRLNVQEHEITCRREQSLIPIHVTEIGICGRTGSGKSSLTLALFRIIDTFQGRIVIDDIDILTVPLTTLRQKLSIIPQDPVLFTGSIRHNLDPQKKCTDQELWEALEIAQLKILVTGLEDGLESDVTEGGENYSVGQRQLFCLARAFLRKSTILVMDEATASIDMETDKILQKVVATAFADRTVLTIAHRVATIIDSDTIVVLSEGKVIECDTPENLLSIEDSVFASLVKGSK